MSTEPTPKRRVELGPTGECVRANVQRIRKGQRLTHADLVERMSRHGYRMPRTALSEIEGGGRRVSADDLVALSIALGVNPNALLFPPVYSDEHYQVSGLAAQAKAHFLWSWADGLLPLLHNEDEAAAVFRTYARPAEDSAVVEPLESLTFRLEAVLKDLQAISSKAVQESIQQQHSAASASGVSSPKDGPEQAQ